MGGAFTAIADDISAAYWNSAGLAQLQTGEINLLHVSYFESIDYEFIGGAIPLAPGSTLGLTAALDSVPSFNSTGNPTATPGSAMDWALGVAFGQSFGENFSLGLGAKFVNSSLLNYDATGEALDAGMLLYTSDREFTLGLSVQNIGQISNFSQNGSAEELPTTYRAGLAYRFDPEKPTHFVLGADLEKPVDEDPIFHLGGEVWLGLQGISVAFRGGYSFNPLNSDLGGNTGASVGAGVQIAPFEFDYALVPFGILGDTNRFSLTYRFEENPGQKTSTESENKTVAVDIKSQLSDYKTGALKQATFEIKPQARTEIKNWTLEIRDPSGNLLRTYSGKGVPPKQIAWDGKDSYGNIVPGGIFANYNFRTEDVRGQQMVSSNPLFKISGVSGNQITPGVMTPALAAILAQSQPVTAPVLPQNLEPVGVSRAFKIPSINFTENSSHIDSTYNDYLDSVSKLIQKYPNARVYIEGRSFREGTDSEALQLSQDRADAVLRYLVEKGKVSPENLYARGHGQEEIQASDEEIAESKNRRVDIVILTK